MPQRVLSEAEYTAIRDQVLRALPNNLSPEDYSRAIGPALEQAIGTAESLPAPPPDGSAVQRFAAGVWKIVNPMNVVQAVAHPIETAQGIASAHLEQGEAAMQAAREGRLSEAVGHGLATVIPVLGPAAAKAGEQIATGDVAGGLGTTAGLIAPFAVSGGLQAARRADPSKAAMLTREAEQQVAQRALAPANPAYKGRAQALAPQMLQRGMTGGRAEWAQAAEEGMADAASRIDAAEQAAGGMKAPVPASPLIADLKARIAELQDSSGQPLSDRAATRITALDKRILQLRALQRNGTIAYEDLKKIRDENWDVAAKARALEKRGDISLSDEGWAARESGDAVRKQFAQRSPAQAEANADYTFWKSLNDVLDPVLGRPKDMAPSQGVTGGARTVGAMTGQVVGGKAGAFVGGVLLPKLKEYLASPEWQLVDAKRKLQLANAVRRGDVGALRTWMVRFEQGAAATSPSGFQRPDQAPGVP